MIQKTAMIILCLLATMAVWAQPPKNGVVKGKIVDRESSAAIEYANVAIYSVSDSSLITGAVTGVDGGFKLQNIPLGEFYLQIKFMGYEPMSISKVTISKKKREANIGTVAIMPDTKHLDGVDVIAEKAPIMYKIDKKVVSPSQFPTAAGGSAVDVLEQTPSITVDVEGNVSLRGSSNFTVLIDGRPSPFDSSEALQQIPTSSIQDIEIITNPSAKYNPEGTAGIINIVTKKSKMNGLSGIVNGTVGSYGNIGGDFLLNLRTDKFNFFTGANYNNREFPGEKSLETETLFRDTLRYVLSEGDGAFQRDTRSWKVGFDYLLSPKTTLSSSMTLGSRKMGRSSDQSYREWTLPTSSIQEYLGYSAFSREGNFVTANFALAHQFAQEGHRLDFDLHYKSSSMDETSTTTQSSADVLTTGQESLGNESDESWRLKLDYVLPLNKTTKLEAGWQSQLETNDADNIYNAFVDGSWQQEDDFSFSTNSDFNIHSGYATFSTELGKLGIQGGLRTELTDRTIRNVESGEQFKLNRWDFFPSFHASLQMDESLQLMGSYTRRINRPRSYFLEPYERYIDSYNVRAGNPELEPEYIDSYEVGVSKRVGKSFISAELYYRVTDNTIERTRNSISPTLTYNTYENVGKDYALGSELMFTSQINKIWRMQLSGNLYDYRVEGVLYDKAFENKSFNWNARLGNTLTFPKLFRLQLDGMYISETATAQGSRSGFYMLNAAVKKEFLKRKLTATLQVRDLLNTMKHESTISTPTYNSYAEFDRKGQMVQLSLSYRLNNFKMKKKPQRDSGGEMDSGDMY